MNIINRSRLVHLSNTTRIAKETHLSPKFWAKCAAIISSMATMEANAGGNTMVSNSTGDALVLGQKISSSGGGPYISLTLAGSGVKIIDYDNSLTTDPQPYEAAFQGDTFVTGGTAAITNAGAFGTGGNVVLAGDTTLQATTETQAQTTWSSAATAINSGFNTSSYTVANNIQLGLSQAENTAISGAAGSDQAAVTATISVDSGDTLTLTGVISEANTAGSTPSTAANILAISGAGTVVLGQSSANTYTGGTTLGGTATLQINTSSAIPSTGFITLGAGTTFKSNYAASLNNSIVLSGSANIDTTASTTTTLSGAISGLYTLTKSGGTGTLALTGASAKEISKNKRYFFEELLGKIL